MPPALAALASPSPLNTTRASLTDPTAAGGAYPSIVAALDANPSLSTLRRAVEAANLLPVLANPTFKATIFAPTDPVRQGMMLWVLPKYATMMGA